MPGIFVSYRRADTSGEAVHLTEDLKARFASDVFIDVDGIRPGVKFEQRLQEALDASDFVLGLIGNKWHTVRTKGRRRLDDDADFVRKEIAAALRREDNVRVIPILVDREDMPSPAALPPDISKLAGLQAFHLRNRQWQRDVAQLFSEIRPSRWEVLRRQVARRVRRHPWLAALAALAAAALAGVLLVSLLGSAADKRADLAFSHRVDRLLAQSVPAHNEISRVFLSMEAAAHGRRSDMSRAEMVRATDEVIVNRTHLKAVVEALPAKSEAARRLRDALTTAFAASITDDRAIASCLDQTSHGHVPAGFYARCIDATKQASKAASESKAHFKSLYNGLRAKLRLAPTTADF